MTRQKSCLTVALDQNVLEEIEHLANQECGRSMASVVREFIAEALQSRGITT